MMGTTRKQHYSKIGLPVVGHSANCTGRSCGIQNNCNIFHITWCIWPITSVVQQTQIIRHLGWLSHWTMGWACHLNSWGESGGCWGILWQLTVLQQQSEGWRGTSWLLTDGMQSITLQPPSSADCRRLYINCIIIQRLPVRSAGN